MAETNGNGGTKVVLNLQTIIGTLLTAAILWAVSLVWTKADNAAPKKQVEEIDNRLRGVETGVVILNNRVERQQEDITETKSDVKDIKTIVEKRLGTAER